MLTALENETVELLKSLNVDVKPPSVVRTAKALSRRFDTTTLVNEATADESARPSAEQLCAVTAAVLVAEDASVTQLWVTKLQKLIQSGRTQQASTAASYCVGVLFPASLPIVDVALERLGDATETDDFTAEDAIDILGEVVPLLCGGETEDKTLAGRILTSSVDSMKLAHRSVSTIPLITRKVTIPLLRGQKEAASVRPLVTMIRDLAAKEQMSEAVVLAAAVFDVLFTSTAPLADAEEDLKQQPFFWELLVKSIMRITQSNEDPSKRQSLHNQIIYLLKRIVSFCEEGLKGSTEVVTFHPQYFRFDPAKSAAAWNNFFIIFESLSEYGLHLVTPAVAKIPALVTDIEPIWIEALLLKGVVHANMGARRLALRTVWSMSVPDYTSPKLTSEFSCEAILRCVGDVRICVEVDHAVVAGNFMDSAAFVGRQEMSIPPVMPVVLLAEAFFQEYLLLAHSNSPAAAKDLIKRMIAVASAPNFARFGICLVLRVIAAAAVPVLDDELCDVLMKFISEAVEDRHPFWLEGRMHALLVDAAIAMVPSGATPNGRFWDLLACSTRNGNTGGRALLSIDSGSATFGSGGSALKPQFVCSRLVATGVVIPDVEGGFARQLLSACLASRKSSEGLNNRIQSVRRLSTLLPRFDAATRESVLRAVLSEAVSLSSRTYASPTEAIDRLMLFAELSEACRIAELPVTGAWQRNDISALWSYLSRSTIACVERGAADQNAKYGDELWGDLHASTWDVRTAACAQCVYRAVEAGCTTADLQLPAFLNSMLTVAENASGAFKAGSDTEYGRMIVVRDTVRAIHAIATANTFEKGVFGGMDRGALDFTAFAKRMQAMRTLQLKVSDTPIEELIDETNWGQVVNQAYRYQWQSIVAILETLEDLEAPGSIPAADLVDECLDQLDQCSPVNLCTIFDAVVWTFQHLKTRRISQLVQTMRSIMYDAQRRVFFRCAARLCFALVKIMDFEEVADVMGEILKRDADSDRVLYFVACSAANAVIGARSAGGEAWEGLKILLHRIAIFTNTETQEKELTASLAVSEPRLQAWSDGARASLPPVVHMASAARCVAVSAIAHQCQADSDVALETVQRLVRWNNSHKVLTKEPCMPNSDTHRARLRTWQLICVLQPTIPAEGLVKIFTEVVQKCVTINNSGSIRRYMEVFVISMADKELKKDNDSARQMIKVLAEATSALEERAQVMGSLAHAAVHLTLKHGDKKYVREALYPLLIRLCSSHQYLLRIIVHVGIHKLFTDAKKAGGAAWKSLPAEMLSLYEYLDKSPESKKKVIEKHGDAVLFNVDHLMSPEQIFCVQRKEADQWLLDAAPASAFHRFRLLDAELSALLGANTAFEHARSARIAREVKAAQTRERLDAVSSLFPVRPAAHDFFIDYAFEAIYTAETPLEDVSGNLQMKVTSWWNSELHNDLHPRAIGSKQRQEIIIVGSLLDNPVNIAGLMRCGEIFAVQSVAVPDKKVFQHPHFIAAARSAELWLPWQEVPAANMADYLRDLRRDGYLIAGIEQTADSQMLTSYQFPSKVAMVLGSEGQGIPANVIPLLDVCLEIPQYGLIRSFNVHTTGAMALYEYSKQHIGRNTAAFADAAVSE